MATITAQLTTVGRLAPLLLVGLVLAPGCGLTDKFTKRDQAKPPVATPATATATGPKPTRVVVAWQPQVVQAADPLRNGSMYPGLAGRLYLFGEDMGFPIICPGKVIVELYDLSQCGVGLLPGAPPAPPPQKPLETWEFDPVTLKRLVRKDFIGEGFTLFLPWGTFKPEITRVQLRTRFEPSAGPAPLFGEPEVLNLSNPFQGMALKHGPVGPNIEQATAPRK